MPSSHALGAGRLIAKRSGRATVTCDKAPVDVVFALLSPVDSGAEHLKTLARVSRYLRDEGQVARLRGAQSTGALHALLAGGEARDAA